MKRIKVKGFLQDAKNTGSIPLRRNELIEAAPDSAVKGDFPANRLADTLHPKNFQLLVKSREIKNGIMIVDFIRRDTDEPFYFKGGQYLGIRFTSENKELFSSLPVLSASGEKVLTAAFTKEYDEKAFKLFEGINEAEICAVSFEGHMNFSGIRDKNGAVIFTDSLALASSLSFIKTAKKLYSEPVIEIYCDADASVVGAFSDYCDGIKINKLSEDSLPEIKNKTLFITGNYEFCEKYASLYNGAEALIKKHPVNTVRGYDSENTYSVRVIYRDKTFELSCREGEILSEILICGGVPADIRCSDGECGYCRMRLLSGEVKSLLLTGEKRTMADVKYGFIHPCSVTPVSDIVLEL